jgi:hypothetical protein
VGGRNAVEDIGNLVLQKMEKNFVDSSSQQQGRMHKKAVGLGPKWA